MTVRAWRCSCGVSTCAVGHEGPFLDQRIAEVERIHTGPGHELVPAKAEDVAPVPVV